MRNPFDLATFAADGAVHVVIDTPKGSRNKFKYDRTLDCFTLSRVLPAGLSFPFDFGSIPGTEGDDGDALDVMVLLQAPSFPGCVVKTRLIGALLAEQRAGASMQRNDRLLGIPVTPANVDEYASLDDLPADLLHQLGHFFVAYNAAQGREFRLIDTVGEADARLLVSEGVERFRNNGLP